MKIRVALLAIAIATLAVAVSADTVWIPTTTSLPTGWGISVVADSGGRGSVTTKALLGENGFQFTQGDANKTVGCRSILGTNNLAGLPLSSITALNIRLLYIEGDQSAQAPKFILKLQKTPTDVSDRSLEWIPFSDGITKQTNVWMDLDAMVDGSWICPNVGTTYTTLAGALAAYPGLQFTSDLTYYPLLTYAFSVGHNRWVSNTNIYNDNNRGMVDWFEIGINGVTTRYDLADVPEPGSLIALAAGLVGFIGLRRRK